MLRNFVKLEVANEEDDAIELCPPEPEPVVLVTPIEGFVLVGFAAVIVVEAPLSEITSDAPYRGVVISPPVVEGLRVPVVEGTFDRKVCPPIGG